MIEDIINNNGHDYVDLCLPSGTIWAICNIGALKPSDCGLYFQWGDIVGYTKDQVGKDKQFSWDDYKFQDILNSSKNGKKYTNPGTKLELKDDAAHINMGGSWHIPSPEQCQELIDHTTINKWIKEDDTYGTSFTSKRYPSKSIFISHCRRSFG